MTPQPYLILIPTLSSSRQPRRQRGNSLRGVPGDLPETLEQGEVFVLGIVRLPTAAVAAPEPDPLPAVRRGRVGPHPAEEVRGRRERRSSRIRRTDPGHRVRQIVVQERVRVGGSKARLLYFGRSAVYIGGVQGLRVHGVELGEHEDWMERPPAAPPARTLYGRQQRFDGSVVFPQRAELPVFVGEGESSAVHQDRNRFAVEDVSQHRVREGTSLPKSIHLFLEIPEEDEAQRGGSTGRPPARSQS